MHVEFVWKALATITPPLSRILHPDKFKYVKHFIELRPSFRPEIPKGPILEIEATQKYLQ